MTDAERAVRLARAINDNPAAMHALVDFGERVAGLFHHFFFFGEMRGGVFDQAFEHFADAGVIGAVLDDVEFVDEFDDLAVFLVDLVDAGVEILSPGQQSHIRSLEYK